MFVSINFRVFLLLLLYVEYSRNASLSVAELKKYKELIEGQGLFSVEDDVEILTAQNFRDHVYGKHHAWVIEFYNSWCGFCQRFAPSWKALATDVKGWKSMVKIGVFDCSDDDNAPICRDFEIMAYPTLRYFHENYQEGPKLLGVDVQKGSDVYSHRQSLISQIIREQQEGRGAMYPNVLPYIHPNITNLFDNVPATTKAIFLLFEPADSLLGIDVAVDLHPVQNVILKYTLQNNTRLIDYARNNLGVTKFPSLLMVTDDKKTQTIDEGISTRESLRVTIKELAKSKGIDLPEETTQRNIFTGKWLDVDIPDINTLMEAREQEVLKQKIKGMGDVVFQMDLETALRYSLKHEVGLVKSVSGEKLEALSTYVDILVKYFPLGHKGQAFLIELRDEVKSAGTSIDGSVITDLVRRAEGDEVFSSPPHWLGCLGSTPERRGYPCGFWKMFHYLTVNAAEHNVANEDPYPREVLDAMHGYIKNFFGCSDCSRHFQEMVREKDMLSVASLDSAVLWLWMAHNEVNKRLAGDATEDPEFPKIQFPSKDLCASCKDSENSWNYPEVLQYLKHMYSNINIRYIGSDNRIEHNGLDGNPAGNGSSSVFKNIDASMCFILYATSFGLIIVLIRIFLKRGYRKKTYVHDLLGKV